MQSVRVGGAAGLHYRSRSAFPPPILLCFSSLWPGPERAAGPNRRELNFLPFFFLPHLENLTSQWGVTPSPVVIRQGIARIPDFANALCEKKQADVLCDPPLKDHKKKSEGSSDAVWGVNFEKLGERAPLIMITVRRHA